MKMNDEKMEKTLENMERYGGSFTKQLAILYRVADYNNQLLLLRCFHDEFLRYAHFGEDNDE